MSEGSCDWSNDAENSVLHHRCSFFDELKGILHFFREIGSVSTPPELNSSVLLFLNPFSRFFDI